MNNPPIKESLDNFNERSTKLHGHVANSVKSALVQSFPNTSESTPIVLSIVIPTFNRAKNVKRALESCLQQTDGRFRVIIVIDGSTDGTEEALAECQDDRVKVIVQANGGVSAARNTGIQAAETEWVAFLDDDDTFLPSFVASAHGLIASHNELDMFWCGVNREFHDPKNGALLKQKTFPAKVDSDLRFVTRFAGSHGFCVRRSFLLNVEGFDHNMAQSEDLDMLLRLLAKGARYAVIPSPQVNLIIHAGPSLSRSGNIQRAIDAHERLLAKNGDLLARFPFVKWHYLYVLSGDYYRQGNRTAARRYLFAMFRLIPWKLRPWERFLKFELILPLSKMFSKKSQ